MPCQSCSNFKIFGGIVDDITFEDVTRYHAMDHNKKFTLEDCTLNLFRIQQSKVVWCKVSCKNGFSPHATLFMTIVDVEASPMRCERTGLKPKHKPTNNKKQTKTKTKPQTKDNNKHTTTDKKKNNVSIELNKTWKEMKRLHCRYKTIIRIHLVCPKDNAVLTKSSIDAQTHHASKTLEISFFARIAFLPFLHMYQQISKQIEIMRGHNSFPLLCFVAPRARTNHPKNPFAELVDTTTVLCDRILGPCS